MIPFSVLGPTRGNRQADLWEAMMNVNGTNRIRSLRYLSGMYNITIYYIYAQVKLDLHGIMITILPYHLNKGLVIFMSLSTNKFFFMTSNNIFYILHHPYF